MLRLIKLAIFSLVGYALYEFARGLLSDGMSFAVDRGPDDLRRAMGSNDGRAHVLTGEGQGSREATLDRNGMSIPHQVGRGVVQH